MKYHPVFSRRILILIVIFALSSQACSLSLIKWPSFPSLPTTSTTVPSGPTAAPLPRAEVTFTVRLPEPLPAGELLAVSVLDEVTGLALNAVDYQMTAVDTITYTAKLAIPDQALIKYRYLRSGASRVTEDTNMDAPIRYRLIQVNGPTQSVYTVSSWTDKAVNSLSGNIFGTV